MIARSRGAVVLIAALAACAPPDDATVRASEVPSDLGTASAIRSADAGVLLAADRAFAEDVGAGGSEAWAAWFGEDGAMIQPGVGEVAGRDAIRDFMAGLDEPGVSLRWEPVRADIASSGDLGWTTGTYVSETPGDDGETARREGRYVSIWRKAEDGSWKVVMDLGNPTDTPQAGT